MQNQQQTETLILEFLRSLDSEHPIQPETDLVSTGILDSLASLHIICYLEKEFDIHIPDSEVNLQNFQSAQTLTGLVLRCLPTSRKFFWDTNLIQYVNKAQGRDRASVIFKK
jgi:acyl carrier protein